MQPDQAAVQAAYIRMVTEPTLEALRARAAHLDALIAMLEAERAMQGNN